MNKSYLIIFLLICISFNSIAKDATKFYRSTNEVLSLLRVDQWIDYVKRVKTDDEIPSYYHFEMPDERLKSYFRKFDILGYESGLKNHINNNFEQEELDLAIKSLRNPFVAKMLNIIMSKKQPDMSYMKQLFLAKDIKIDKKRLPLIKSLYNLMQFNVMTDHVLSIIHLEEKEAEELNKILQKGNNILAESTNGKIIKTKEEEVKKIFLVNIFEAYKKATINELREMVRQLKSKQIQKLVGLYNAYDFFYIYKFNRMIYDRNIQDYRRGLKSEKMSGI